jgi:hypothetical protein
MSNNFEKPFTIINNGNYINEKKNKKGFSWFVACLFVVSIIINLNY